MAGNKSSEGKVTTLECIDCGYREVFTERQFKLVDGFQCDACDGPVLPAITKPGEEVRNRKTNNKSKSVGSFHVDIDCSDALKGLKAIQREAKKATQALKELEEQQKRVMQ